MNRNAILLSLLLALSGCGGGKSDDPPWQQEPATGYGGAAMSLSVERVPVVVERFGLSGPVVLLFHSIHGNEIPAEQCGQRMRSWLLSHPQSYRDVQVAFITQANPDGYLIGTRHNSNGIDLNRNFPASNFEPSDTFGPSPASEPETRVIVDVVEFASPAAIVSVHAPLDAINYDGPAQELAELASQDTGIPIDQDIGVYPGSFGSWSGLDLQIPTITLEAPPSLLASAEHLKWLRVEELALDWVSGKNLSAAPDLANHLRDGEDSDIYLSIGIGDSAGGRPLAAERFGRQDPALLVVAGLDGSDIPVLCAERYRSRLLSSPSPGRVLLITLANPDGLAGGTPLNDQGLHPDKSFPKNFTPGDDSGSQPFESQEASAIRNLIENYDIAAVVTLLGSQDQLQIAQDGPADSMLQAAEDALYSAPQPMDSTRPGSLSAWAADLGLPSLTIAIPAEPAEIDLMRADNLGLTLQAISESIR